MAAKKATKSGAQELPQQQVAGADVEKQVADHDARIAELEGQVVEVAENVEAMELFCGEISEVKAKAESDRMDFKLQFAGVRNVKAVQALLGDHGNDVDRLKEAKLWLLRCDGKHGKSGDGSADGGTTGLTNAGAATDFGKQLRHRREVAGLTDEDRKKE